MKYKIIKKIPFFYTLDKVVETNDANLIKLIGSNLYINPGDWPEYFEPVKEPLFTTYDGVKIFEMKGYVHEVYKTETSKCIRLDCFPNNKSSNFISDDNYKYFSTEEAAEKWIDENKPVFSKKQISEILDKFVLGKYEIRDIAMSLRNVFGL